MKKIHPAIFLFMLFGVLVCLAGYSQPGCGLLQSGSPAALTTSASNFSYWFGVMELPFLFISVFFAFSTSRELRGGRLGKGMNLLAWGYLVMAIGHLHMQLEHFYGINLFKLLLGQVGGSVAWFVALVITWGLSGLGFYSIYKASKNA
ncbi:MAG TPA: hypothetical protein VGM41_07215 [Chitinophagaceae bacterium]